MNSQVGWYSSRKRCRWRWARERNARGSSCEEPGATAQLSNNELTFGFAAPFLTWPASHQTLRLCSLRVTRIACASWASSEGQCAPTCEQRPAETVLADGCSSHGSVVVMKMFVASECASKKCICEYTSIVITYRASSCAKNLTITPRERCAYQHIPGEKLSLKEVGCSHSSWQQACFRNPHAAYFFVDKKGL